MDTPALALTDIEFAWPHSDNLLSIDRFVLRRGERVFVGGPSGSGKSTLLGIIGGVLKPQSGSVEVMGTRLNSLSAGRADRFRGDHMGFIFQSFNLLPYLPVLANVLLPMQFSALRRQRLAGHSHDDEAKRLLSALGLADSKLLEKPVNELSIGQQQRVAAARALVGRPELLIADEPTSSLDADTRADFLKLLTSECERFGTAVLFVSHEWWLGHLFHRQVYMADINRISCAA